MRFRTFRVFATPLLVALVHIAHPVTLAAQKRDPDRITRAEIEQSAQATGSIQDVIRSLRPKFLTPVRGVRSLRSTVPPLVVYINENRAGDASFLEATLAADVEEVRYFDPVRAQDAYGITASGGAIVLKLRDSAKPPPQP